MLLIHGGSSTQVRVVLMSSWSQWDSQGEVEIGLNEIEFLDADGQCAPVAVGSAYLNGELSTDILRLTTGTPRTTNPRNMWKATIGTSPEAQPLVLDFFLPSRFPLYRVALWNYNRPNCETYGVKEAMILVNGHHVWHGTVQRAPGRSNSDFTQQVNIPADALVPATSELEAETILSSSRQRELETGGAGPARKWASLPNLADESEITATAPASSQPTVTEHAVPLWLQQGNPPARPASESQAQRSNVPPWLQSTRRKTAQERSPSPEAAKPVRQVSNCGSMLTPHRRRTPSMKEIRPPPIGIIPQRSETPPLGIELQAAGRIRARRGTPASVVARLSFVEPSVPEQPREEDNGRCSTPGPEQRRHRRPGTPGGGAAATNVMDGTELFLDNPPRRVNSYDVVEQRHGEQASTQKFRLDKRSPPPSVAGEGRRCSLLEESWDSLSLFKLRQAGRFRQSVAVEACTEMAPRPALLAVTDQTDALTAQAVVVAPSRTVIPELPSGQVLVLQVLSTWGDQYYAGLTGLEVYNRDGQEVAGASHITADPAGLMVVPGHEKDPRAVTNLLDGVNRTCDDVHMWLAPYSPGLCNSVTITLKRRETVAAIRIYNYNSSRIHSYRGVRDVQLHLDSCLIFEGEVARAPGHIRYADPRSYGELILFTTRPRVLQRLAAKDKALAIEAADEQPALDPGPDPPDRPVTSYSALTPACPVRLPSPQTAQTSRRAITGRCLAFDFLETWGDCFYLGLTGLEVVDEGGQPISLVSAAITATPADLNDGVQCGGHDVRTLDKLFDHVNLTTLDQHMWLTSFSLASGVQLRITWPSPIVMAGVRVWNYNKSSDDTARGVKRAHVTLDGTCVVDGLFLRKAPGHARFDFGQYIPLTWLDSSSQSAMPTRQPSPQAYAIPGYVLVKHATGLQLTLRLLSTCGDSYYIGLNGLRLLDMNGRELPLYAGRNLFSFPESVNSLDGMAADPRTLDKLVDGVNVTAVDHHMWLAPLLEGSSLPGTDALALTQRTGGTMTHRDISRFHCQVKKMVPVESRGHVLLLRTVGRLMLTRMSGCPQINTIEIIFDSPVSLGAILFWNYVKTPARGVHHFQVLLDDRFVSVYYLFLSLAQHWI